MFAESQGAIGFATKGSLLPRFVNFNRGIRLGETSPMHETPYRRAKFVLYSTSHSAKLIALKKETSKNDQAQSTAAAVREERRRIFRELHDRALQLLSTVRLRAEVCRREFIRDPEALEKELLIIEENTQLAVAEIRRLLSESQSETDLVAGTLERRLREEIEIFRSRSGMQLTFHCAVDCRSLPYTVERELYFALREGVINAIRHSRASELRLFLTHENQTCKASLQDDGTGFDLESTEGGSHYGLRIMRERIEKLGGQFAIDTAPGKGTRISMTVPLR